ncbi:hypothetical protein KA005_60670, partial [bacterium]|nr:hypothetical protein [bacterium]
MRVKFSFTVAFFIACFTLSGINLSVVKASSWQPSNMPIVFVDPPTITASVGENFTISVKIFNLTDNFYIADESPPGLPQWEPGEPLPPPGHRFNYSLGNLYGLELYMSWDPSLLEYVNHTRKTPIEDYPDGILYGPVGWADEVNQSLGTYWFLAQEATLTPVFNNPNENSTVFCMIFRGKKEGLCTFNLTEVGLVTPLGRLGFQDALQGIPYWMLNGQVDVVPELHLFMLPAFLIGTLAAVLLKLKLC